MINKKDTAVLIINGFLTRGIEMKTLYETLKEKTNYDILFPMVPTGEEGNKIKLTKYKEFDDFIFKYINILKDYKNIFIIGYSIGGNIACEIASKIKIDSLILVSPAFKYVKYHKAVLELGKTILDKNAPRDRKYFYKEVLSRLKKTPKWNLLVGRRYVKKSRKTLELVNCPIFTLLALQDEIIKPDGVKWGINNTNSQKITYKIYKESGHLIFMENQRKKAAQDVLDYINSILKDKE